MTESAAASDRRAFLLRVLRLGGASAATLGLGAYLAGRSQRPAEGAAAAIELDHRVADRPDLPEMAVAQGEAASPAALVERAIADMGGMGRFVSRGDTVVVKPNIAWDRLPEHAATTNHQRSRTPCNPATTLQSPGTRFVNSASPSTRSPSN